MLAALAGILFLTFYPFRFSAHANLPPGAFPLLLGKGAKSGGSLDILLNILLFIPFGLGLSMELRSRGRSWTSIILCSWLAGALLSYFIEFVQLYVPARDSGWEDVITNSTGSLVGCLSLALLGSSVLPLLDRFESTLQEWLTTRRAAVLVVAFLIFGFAISAKWQAQAGIRDWHPSCFLVIGNDATRQHFWPGRVSRLDIWSTAVPAASARSITRGTTPIAAPLPILSFDLSGPTPRQESAGLSVKLSRIMPPRRLPDAHDPGVSFDEESWFSSVAPVTNLISVLRTSNQFSFRAIITPRASDSTGRILSLSEPSGLSDVYLRQEDSSLILWFRTSLSSRRSALAWNVPNILVPNQQHDVLFSFDGSVLRLYIDGNYLPDYRLSPGTAFAQLLRTVKSSELKGYEDIYYASLFLPLGGLLGIAFRNESSRRTEWGILFVAILIFAPLLLEWILVHVSGRPPLASNVVRSVLLMLAGLLWINSDYDSAARRRSLLRHDS